MPAGFERKVRRRMRGCDGSGGGGGGGGARGGGGGRGSWATGRGSRTVTTSTVIAVATGVARDVRDPDGLLRPVLRSLAARLAASRRPGIGRVGEQYLRLDPPLPDASGDVVAARTAGALPKVTETAPGPATTDGRGATDAPDIIDGEVVEEAVDDPSEAVDDPSEAVAPDPVDAAASGCRPRQEAVS